MVDERDNKTTQDLDVQQDEREAIPRRRIVIVGAGQTGRALVRLLSAAWEIAILDTDQENWIRLGKRFPIARSKSTTKTGPASSACAKPAWKEPSSLPP